MLLQFHHVYRRFSPAAIALEDVTFAVDKGEFVFLTGPSGAGKSTLLRMVYGAESPTKGHVMFEGMRIDGFSRDEISRLRRRIGVVFQDFKLLGDRHVFDNVAYPLIVSAVKPSRLKPAILRVLAEVGLANRWKEHPKNLSGGEQQRVAIARAIANNPLVVLADEPTGNLDPSISIEIVDLLRRINVGGTAVLMATHDFELISRYRFRTIFLDRGRVVRETLDWSAASCH
jgi:cell division transport system ATP-binding protein